MKQSSRNDRTTTFRKYRGVSIPRRRRRTCSIAGSLASLPAERPCFDYRLLEAFTVNQRTCSDRGRRLTLQSGRHEAGHGRPWAGLPATQSAHRRSINVDPVASDVLLAFRPDLSSYRSVTRTHATARLRAMPDALKIKAYSTVTAALKY